MVALNISRRSTTSFLLVFGLSLGIVGCASSDVADKSAGVYTRSIHFCVENKTSEILEIVPSPAYNKALPASVKAGETYCVRERPRGEADNILWETNVAITFADGTEFVSVQHNPVLGRPDIKIGRGTPDSHSGLESFDLSEGKTMSAKFPPSLTFEGSRPKNEGDWVNLVLRVIK